MKAIFNCLYIIITLSYCMWKTKVLRIIQKSENIKMTFWNCKSRYIYFLSGPWKKSLYSSSNRNIIKEYMFNLVINGTNDVCYWISFFIIIYEILYLILGCNSLHEIFLKLMTRSKTMHLSGPNILEAETSLGLVFNWCMSFLHFLKIR